MRIACPTCDATYDVPDALIGTGRRLRCAKCTHEWLAGPESPAVPAPAPIEERPLASPSAFPSVSPLAADAAPPPMIEPRRPAPVQAAAGPEGSRRRAAAALWAAWIGSGLLLGAAGAGAWIYRGPIMGAWPPAARLYLLFGAAEGDAVAAGADPGGLVAGSGRAVGPGA